MLHASFPPLTHRLWEHVPHHQQHPSQRSSLGLMLFSYYQYGNHRPAQGTQLTCDRTQAPSSLQHQSSPSIAINDNVQLDRRRQNSQIQRDQQRALRCRGFLVHLRGRRGSLPRPQVPQEVLRAGRLPQTVAEQESRLHHPHHRRQVPPRRHLVQVCLALHLSYTSELSDCVPDIPHHQQHHSRPMTLARSGKSRTSSPLLSGSATPSLKRL